VFPVFNGKKEKGLPRVFDLKSGQAISIFFPRRGSERWGGRADDTPALLGGEKEKKEGKGLPSSFGKKTEVGLVGNAAAAAEKKGGRGTGCRCQSYE